MKTNCFVFDPTTNYSIYSHTLSYCLDDCKCVMLHKLNRYTGNGVFVGRRRGGVAVVFVSRAARARLQRGAHRARAGRTRVGADGPAAAPRRPYLTCPTC